MEINGIYFTSQWQLTGSSYWSSMMSILDSNPALIGSKSFNFFLSKASIAFLQISWGNKECIVIGIRTFFHNSRIFKFSSLSTWMLIFCQFSYQQKTLSVNWAWIPEAYYFSPKIQAGAATWWSETLTASSPCGWAKNKNLPLNQGKTWVIFFVHSGLLWE